jgi:hypothetical protein
MQDEFGDEPAKSKTRSELQDDLRKYGITPRPGYDPKGPNLPEYRNYLDEVDTKDKAKDKAKTRAIGPSGGGGGGGSGDLEKGMMGGRFKPVAKAKGGSVSSASRRADGCATKGKTRGRMV